MTDSERFKEALESVAVHGREIVVGSAFGKHDLAVAVVVLESPARDAWLEDWLRERMQLVAALLAAEYDSQVLDYLATSTESGPPDAVPARPDG